MKHEMAADPQSASVLAVMMLAALPSAGDHRLLQDITFGCKTIAPVVRASKARSRRKGQSGGVTYQSLVKSMRSSSNPARPGCGDDHDLGGLTATISTDALRGCAAFEKAIRQTLR